MQIIDKKYCSGCHACYSICPSSSISMISDQEGFLYPRVDQESCDDCGLCKEICPVINNTDIVRQPVGYAAYNRDEDIRVQSSSGGIFTLIAEAIIDRSGVVFGVGFDNKFNVVHYPIENKEGLSELRGSKYVQSTIGDTYKIAGDFLNSGKKVLFTGTPCQIAGLKSYLQVDYDNLFTQDIICHGVPSPKAWRHYLSYISNDESIKSISFRNKDLGWHQFSMKIETDKNSYRGDLSEDLFFKAFLKNICLRPSCYNCHFKTLHRLSDLTLADFWGIELVLPEMDDDKGMSLVMVNSGKGRDLLDSVKDSTILREIDLEQAIKYNSSATKSVPLPAGRKLFFDNLESMPFNNLVKECTKESPMKKLKKKAYRVGSKIKRLIK